MKSNIINQKNTSSNFFIMAALGVMVTNSTQTEAKTIQAIENPTANISVPISLSSTRLIDSNRYSLDKLKTNKRILTNLKRLDSNWNGYQGEQISEAIIEKTEELISNVDFQPQIFPTGRGSIQIEYFRDDNNLIEIEISEDENFMYKCQNGEEFEGEISVNDIPQIISDFYA